LGKISKPLVSQFLSGSKFLLLPNVPYDQTYTYGAYIVVLSFVKSCALME
jgi:hypothetical protein